jgi:hypothetical protein
MKFKFFFLFLCFHFSIRGQIIQGGLAFGKSVYWGDLNAPEFSSNLNNNGGLAIQAFIKKNYRNQFGAKLGLLMGKLQANDNNSTQDWQKERNLSFRTRIFELSAMGEYYFFGFDPNSTDKPFSPYVTAGVAVFISILLLIILVQR